MLAFVICSPFRYAIWSSSFKRRRLNFKQFASTWTKIVPSAFIKFMGLQCFNWLLSTLSGISLKKAFLSFFENWFPLAEHLDIFCRIMANWFWGTGIAGLPERQFLVNFQHWDVLSLLKLLLFWGFINQFFALFFRKRLLDCFYAAFLFSLDAAFSFSVWISCKFSFWKINWLFKLLVNAVIKQALRFLLQSWV